MKTLLTILILFAFINTDAQMLVKKTSTSSSFVNEYYVTFDGVNDTADFTEVAMSGAFSVAYWIRSTSAGAGYIHSSYTSNSWNYHLRTDRFRISLSGSQFTIDMDTLFVANRWYHVVWTRNSSNLITMYTNGSAQSVTQTTSTDWDITVFGYASQYGSFAQWDMDEFLIYDNDIGASGVSTLYNSSIYDPTGCGDPTDVSGLTNDWRIDGSTYPTLTDGAGTSDATMNNMDSGDIVAY